MIKFITNVIIEYFTKHPRSKLITIILGVMLISFLGIIDQSTDLEIIFPSLYLIPIFIVVWFTGILPGFLISFLAAIILYVTRVIVGKSFSHNLILYWRTLGRLILFFIFCYIISELKNSLIREKKLAKTDSLTGILNRRAFSELTNIEIDRSRRYKHHFTVAYIDIDNFKTVNDNLGHNVGDELLKTIAETIKNSIRSSDIVARLGGDEFAILFPETGDRLAKSAIKNVRKNVLDIVKVNNWPVTFSIGVVTFTNMPNSIDDIMRKADTLMYSVKLNGKNGVKHEIVTKEEKDGKE